MRKIAKLLGFIAILAIIGFSSISCKDGGTDNGNAPVTIPDICSDCGEAICECIVLPITEITVEMWDSYGDGWDGNGALRINVNGNDISSNVKASGSSSNYFFQVSNGDIIRFYWIEGSNQEENAFAVFYTNNPPDPSFNPDPSNWLPSYDPTGKVLLYKQYNTMTDISDGDLIGSFTIGGKSSVTPTVGIEVTLDVMNEWELVDQSTQVAANTNKIFTVNGSYSIYQWYLDGTLVSSSSSYTFNKPKGVYQLMVVVTNSSGESRSARCWITVDETTSIYPISSTITVGGSMYIGSLGEGQIQYIRVYLNAGNTYRIRWNDSDNTTGYTDIMVGLINESTSITVQSIVDNSSTNNFTYTVPSSASGNYLIAVKGYNTSNSGTYAVGCAIN